ncbi:MAG: winged helix-turn-helix domain-containing protein [Methanobrevibacter sp.]|nr:winged helix-turn-helix domain-containing protein [Methanobrevibacter sp.]
MAVPEISDLLLPLLETIKDKDEYKVKEITDDVIDVIEISEEDKNVTLPNGETLIESRISSANTYLRKAELIESNRFLYYNITEEGLKVLDENPDGLSEEDLMKYPAFKELKAVYTHDDIDDKDIPSPQDAFKQSLQKQMEDVRNEISQDVLKENKVKYFQPKNQKEFDEIYEIRSRRDVSKKDSKDKKKGHENHDHKHKRPKYIIYKQFSPADELLKYAELFERGYLTKEEFDKKKEELLNL